MNHDHVTRVGPDPGGHDEYVVSVREGGGHAAPANALPHCKQSHTLGKSSLAHDPNGSIAGKTP